MNADPQKEAVIALAEAEMAARALAIGDAHVAASRAWAAAHRAGNAELAREVERFEAALAAPVARTANGEELNLAAVAKKINAPRSIVLDGRRCAVFFKGTEVVNLASRPLTFDLLAALAEKAPSAIGARDLARVVFGTKTPRPSHELRLRRQLGRIRSLAKNKLGKFIYGERKLRWESPVQPLVLLPMTPLIESRLEGLLSDGRAWSVRSLAKTLNESGRDVELGLAALAKRGAATTIGQGKSLRWQLRVAPLAALLR